MKKLLILLIITGILGCRTDMPSTGSKPVYSEYRSEGGFNYMEDVIEVFNIDTTRAN